MQQIRVGISGAGISGLVLGGILARQPGQFRVDIFDKAPRERDQGTGFDIDREGQAVLRRVGITPEKFRQISRAGSDSMRFFRGTDERPFAVLGMPRLLAALLPPEPETNRELLREAMIEAAGDALTMRFDVGVKELRQTLTGTEMIAHDGSVLGEYDICVDCSGTGSPLRSLRVADPPGYSVADAYVGVSIVHGVITDPERSLHPGLLRMLGQGTCMVFLGRGQGFFSLQRYGASAEDRRTSFYFAVERPSIGDLRDELGLPGHGGEWVTGAALETAKQRTKALMPAFLHDMYRECVDAVDKLAVRPLFQNTATPNFIDDNDLPLICIGDSLHAVPPYTGSGAKLAMKDAVDVADYLLKCAADGGRIDVCKLRALETGIMARVPEVHESAREFRAAMDIPLSQLSLGSFFQDSFVLRQLFRLTTWEDSWRY